MGKSLSGNLHVKSDRALSPAKVGILTHPRTPALVLVNHRDEFSAVDKAYQAPRLSSMQRPMRFCSPNLSDQINEIGSSANEKSTKMYHAIYVSKLLSLPDGR